MRGLSRLLTVLGLMMGLSLPAWSQGLPQSVAEPYLRYQEAQESGDLAAAQVAAGEAYNAAIAAGLERETIGILAEVYGYLASENGDAGIAYDILREAAEIADETGAPGSDRGWRWSLAANAADGFGQADQALARADRALAALYETGEIAPMDRPIEGDMQVLRMRVFSGRGNVTAAGDAAARALAAFRADNGGPDGQMGLIFYHLGVADYAVGRWPDAFAHFHMAVDLLNAADAPEAVLWRAWAFAEMSRVLASDGDTEAAEPANWALHADMESQHRAAARRLERYDYLEDESFRDASVLQGEPVTFPDAAGEQQGFVLVGFDVSASGQTENVRVLFEQPSAVFGTSAVEAIEARLYAPATIGGGPVTRAGLLQLVMFADGQATAADFSFSTGAAAEGCGFTGSSRRDTAELGGSNDGSCLARQGEIYERGYRGGLASSRCPNPGSCGGQ